MCSWCRYRIITFNCVLSIRSEANDLALRLARLHTKREDVAVFERYYIIFINSFAFCFKKNSMCSSYHGNIASLVDVSTKSFKR